MKNTLSLFLWLILVLAVVPYAACAQQSSSIVIFLGDSIMFDYQVYPQDTQKTLINLSVPAGKIPAIEQAAQLASSFSPESIFIMTGVNDVSDGRISEFAYIYDSMLGGIQKASPRTRIYVESILPVNGLSFPALKTFGNDAIQPYNNAIASIVANRPGTTLLDFRPQFTDVAGNLRKELTKDGLHLNIDGLTLLGDLMSAYY